MAATLSPTNTAGTAGQRAQPRPGYWTDTVMVLVCLLVAGLSWGPVFGGLTGYRAVSGGILVGAVLGCLCAWWRFSALGSTVILVLGYLLAGGPVTLPATTWGGVLPTLTTIQLLVMQAVDSWMDLLTLRPPAAAFTGPSVAPYLAGWALAALAVGCALRLRRPATALAPIWLLCVGGILWGLAEAPATWWSGLALAALSIGWAGLLRHRHRRATADGDLVSIAAPDATLARSLRARGAGQALVLLASAAVLAAVLAPAVVGDQRRDVLRQHVTPPLDLQQYASPLTRFRYLERQQEKTTLLSVTGLPTGTRLSIGVLESYDGVVYGTATTRDGSGGFAQVGEDVVADPDPQAHRLSVRVQDYQAPWVPIAGQVQTVRYSGASAATQADQTFYNQRTGTLLNRAGLSKGTRYDLTTVLPRTPDRKALAGEAFGQPPLPSIGPVPTAAAAKAAEYVEGKRHPYEQAVALAENLRTDGRFSSKTSESLPGHSLSRLGKLFSGEQMIGDDEQYAVAMAQMARSLGMPARVVMGFYRPDAGKGRVSFTGADAHVWVEVNFEKSGWVAFDPTPSKPPDAQTVKQHEQPTPQLLQPPDPPSEPPDQPLKAVDSPAPQDETSIPQVVWTILLVVAVAAGVLGLLLAPVLLVLSLKRARSLRRRNARSPAARASGGWEEVLDKAMDLGSGVPSTLTRQESAERLAERFELAATLTLARRADAAVFGHGDPEQEQLERLWQEVDAILTGMERTVSRRRRLGARLSPRSLWWRWRTTGESSWALLRRAAAAGRNRLRRRAARRFGRFG